MSQFECRVSCKHVNNWTSHDLWTSHKDGNQLGLWHKWWSLLLCKNLRSAVLTTSNEWISLNNDIRVLAREATWMTSCICNEKHGNWSAHNGWHAISAAGRCSEQKCDVSSRYSIPVIVNVDTDIQPIYTERPIKIGLMWRQCPSIVRCRLRSFDEHDNTWTHYWSNFNLISLESLLIQLWTSRGRPPVDVLAVTI